LAVLLGTVSCQGKVLQLGNDPAPYHFGTPALVPELAYPAQTDNPTFTSDMLEIFFTTRRDKTTGVDVWFAKRAGIGDPFGTPGPVPKVNSEGFETSSAISSDGLTLWFGSDRDGGLGGVDIWFSTRTSRSAEWSTPENLTVLNSMADDIPRSPGQHGLVMPLASSRVSPTNPGLDHYQAFAATRPTIDSPFAVPTILPIVPPDLASVDGFLTEDGLTFFFCAGPARTGAADAAVAPIDGGTDSASAKGDLYVAFRRSTTLPFSYIQALSDLNTLAYDERDPWLSPDGSTFYFTSDRDGVLNIYSAPVKPR
jgi:hypothetical protein